MIFIILSNEISYIILNIAVMLGRVDIVLKIEWIIFFMNFVVVY